MAIKKASQNKGAKFISPDTSLDKLRSLLNNHPVFCFQFLHKAFAINNCEAKERASFIERICELSTRTWVELQTAPHEGWGSEKIHYSAIKPTKPTHITKETQFLSFRFPNKHRFVGYRNDFVFHVIYIDTKLKVYDH